MPRFRKGTMDHDGDGRKGGSMAKASTRKAAPKKKAAPRVSAEETANIKAEAVDMASVSDPQSGGAQMRSEELPDAKAVIEHRKEAVAAQFAEADAKADPSPEDAALSRQVRGW